MRANMWRIACLLGYLSLSKLCGAVNVALNMQATQSFDLDYGGYVWEAGLAVDGCKPPFPGNNYEGSRCCSGSFASPNNVWSVDLAIPYVLERIVIYGRSDIDTQLAGFQVFGRETPASPEQSLYNSAGQPYNNGLFEIPVTSNTAFTIVTIKRFNGPLVLCEVEVYAAQTTQAPTTTTVATTTTTTTTAATTTTTAASTTTSEPVPSIQPSAIVSRFKPATQANSLIYLFEWTAGKAVDGDYRSGDPNFDASCAASQQATGNYWRVDLIQQYIVDRVLIFSRSDGQDQITGFQVFGQTDDTSPAFPIAFNSDPLGNGSFTVFVVPPATLKLVIIRRANLLTLCEVDVYGVPLPQETPTVPTTTTTAAPTPQQTTQPVTSTTETSTTLPRVNVALNKPASQLEDLFYTFWWFASLAVDGCYDRSDPNNVPCCSTSMGVMNNFWRVDLGSTFLIEEVVLYGRSDQSDQLPGFTLHMQETDSSVEEVIFDSTGLPYGDGVYTVIINPPRLAKWVTVRRNGVITLCEVEVFETQALPPATSTTAEVTTTTTTSPSTTTTTPGTTTTTILATSTTTETVQSTIVLGVNLALNKPAYQLEDLFYNFWWFASLAVDGCYERTDPNNVPCCATSMGVFNNFWRVDLLSAFFIDRVVLYGRADQADQLPGFQLFIQHFDLAPEELIYDSTGVPYESGIYTIPISPPRMAKMVTVRRNGVITLCEVEVFQGIIPSTSGSTTTITSESTTTEPTSTTETSTSADTTSVVASTTQPLATDSVATSTTPVTSSVTPSVTAGTTTLAVSSGGVNVAVGQMASHKQSLNYNGFVWTADKAVDGCYNRAQPDTSMCCSCSESMISSENFWRVDFDVVHSLMKIVVYGRGDHGTQLNGFMLHINDTNTTPVYNDLGNPYTDGIYEIILEPEVYTSSIIVTRPAGIYITLCEVEAISSCSDGFFGETCSNRCGKCLNGTNCYKITGTCPNGCAAGFQGSQCLTGCAPGTYGVNCQEFCGNCLAGAPCNNVSGICTVGCDPGWSGSLCKTPCEDGTYGINCQMKCVNCAAGTFCNKVTGVCESGCSPGWQGQMCDTPCPEGFFGDGCMYACGNCAVGVGCNNVNGSCPGQCQAGWQPPMCNTGCDEGTHGIDCNETCGKCLGAAGCDGVTSECPGGLCEAGYTGMDCKQACPEGFFGVGCMNVCGNCAVGVGCNNVNGSCPGQCQAGWKPPMCNTVCDEGSHGIDCNETCGKCLGAASCDRVTSECPSGLCEAGYTGLDCKQACPEGFYGFGCMNSCGNCAVGDGCHNVNGHCPGQCQVGWKPPLCNTGCDEGTHGIDCNETCGKCLGAASCDRVTSECPGGLCEAGYTGMDCKQACPPGSFGPNCMMTCGNCENVASCDSITGACPGNCAPGWEGNNCDQEISTTTTTTATTTTSQAVTTQTTQQITHDPTSEPSPITTLGPTTGSTQGPTQGSTIGPTQGSSEGPTQGSTLGPTQGPTQGSTQGSTQGPTQESTQGPTQGSTQGPTQGSTQRPTQGSTQGPTQGSTQGPTQGSTNVPTQEQPQESTQAQTQSSTQLSTQGPTQGSTVGSSQDPALGTTLDSTEPTIQPTDGQTGTPPHVITTDSQSSPETTTTTRTSDQPIVTDQSSNRMSTKSPTGATSTLSQEISGITTRTSGLSTKASTLVSTKITQRPITMSTQLPGGTTESQQGPRGSATSLPSSCFWLLTSVVTCVCLLLRN